MAKIPKNISRKQIFLFGNSRSLLYQICSKHSKTPAKTLAWRSKFHVSIYLQRYICWQMQLIALHADEYSQVS